MSFTQLPASMKTLRSSFWSQLQLAICLLLCCVALTAQSASEAREPTKLELKIVTARNINQTEKKEPAPIEIRLYELKSAQVFETADYFSLYDKDSELLGPDLLKKEVFILRPGEKQLITRSSDSDTTVIGVLAGYRDLARSVWRSTYKLPEAPVTSWYRAMIPSNKTSLIISVEENGLRITED